MRLPEPSSPLQTKFGIASVMSYECDANAFGNFAVDEVIRKSPQICSMELRIHQMKSARICRRLPYHSA